MRKSLSVEPLHNTRSLQSTRNGLTQKKHLRGSPCKSDHESVLIGLLKKVCMENGTQQVIGSFIGKSISKAGISAGTQLEESVPS